MFKRIFYENWHAVIPVVAFLLTFGVYLCYVVRAVRMRKPEVERLSRMPLDESPND